METKPKWAQPVFGAHCCSICKNEKVYYKQFESWEEAEVTPTGIIRSTCFALKCWCKDCFEDCGGKLSDWTPKRGKLD